MRPTAATSSTPDDWSAQASAGEMIRVVAAAAKLAGFCRAPRPATDYIAPFDTIKVR